MFATVSVSQVVAVEVMLLFPVVSFQDVWFGRVAQVGHGQIDGRLQSAQVHLHVTGRQFQLRLQRLTVLAHRVLDQIAANVSVDLKQILQAPSNLRISQAGETKIPLIRVRIYTVQLFLHLRNKAGSIDETWLDRFLGRHVPALEVFQRFLPMLGILQPKIRPLQKINPTLFLFRIVALRAVGLEKGLNREGFRLMNFTLWFPGNVLENMVTGRLLPICSHDKGKQRK